jgi:hypothetical protein
VSGKLILGISVERTLAEQTYWLGFKCDVYEDRA